MLLSFVRNPAFRRRRNFRLTPGNSSTGFTLLELLAVLGILAVLAGLVLGIGRRAGEASRVARTKVELAVLAAALEDYRRVCGDYPQTNDAAQLLQSLIGRRGPRNAVIAIHALIEVARFTTAEAADPSVDLSTVLVDPWARAYRYTYKVQSPWANSSYVLYSIGPDGRDSAGLLAGGFVDPAPPENADNLYANRN